MTDDRPTIYLAGPVQHVDGGGADWREQVQEFYADEYDFRDPLSKYNVPADDLTIVDGVSNPENDATVGVEEIVERDKGLLKESDGVLVGYSAVQSVGTPMEVMWAHERGYPIALWVRDDTEFGGLSPWYRYHATAITTAVGMGLSHIRRYANAEAPFDEPRRPNSTVVDPAEVSGE
jgi:hypothetical protein